MRQFILIHFPIRLMFLFSFFLNFSITAAQKTTLHFEYIIKGPSVTCITQDSLGFLWFGTREGLYRYDGKNIRRFKHSLSRDNSPSGNEVMTIAVQNKSIWGGTFRSGLDRFDLVSEKWTRYTAAQNSINNNKILCLFIDSDYDLWFATGGGGIALLTAASGKKYNFVTFKHQSNVPTSLMEDVVYTIYEQTHNKLWFGTRMGLCQLYSFEKDGAVFISYPQIEEKVKSILSGVKESINEVREISQNLHPHLLDRLGLNKALESVIKKVSKSSGIRIEYELDEVEKFFDKEKQIHFYRIIQEALNNIVKHARADKVEIKIEKKRKYLYTIVRDNGKGFDIKKVKAANHSKIGFGLANMQERARLIGGNFSISSRLNKGTEIKMSILLKKV